MGMMLAAEPAEPGVMNRPPRRPGKRLLGKLVIWRCLFVCAVLVVLVLSMFFWCSTDPSNSLDMCRCVEGVTVCIITNDHVGTAASQVHPLSLCSGPKRSTLLSSAR